MGLFRQHFSAPTAVRPDLARTDIDHRYVHETPRGRICAAQQTPRLPIYAVPGIKPRSRGHSRRNPVAGARNHTHRHAVHDQPPILPLMELSQIIRAHDPDKPHFGIKTPQFGQRIRRRPRSCQRLDIRHLDPRVLQQPACRRHSLRKRRRPPRLQGVARRHQPPHPIQPKRLHRLERDMHMSMMRRIKRSTEQTHDLPRVRIWNIASQHPLLMFRTARRCQSTGCTTSPSFMRPGRTTSAHHPPCPRTAE